MISSYEANTLTWFIDCTQFTYQAFYGKESPLFRMGESFHFIYQPFGSVEVVLFLNFEEEELI